MLGFEFDVDGLDHDVDGPIDAPAYVCTPQGIVAIPLEARPWDACNPINVPIGHWDAIQRHHGAFAASVLLPNIRRLRCEHIVVVRNWTEDSDGRRVVSVLPACTSWFLRISLKGNRFPACVPKRSTHLGDSFLWQIPYAACRKIINDIEDKHAEDHSWLHPDEAVWTHPLAKELAATHHDFNLEYFPTLRLITHLTDYGDCTFAMAVRPASGTLATLDENRHLSMSLARPLKHQPFDGRIGVGASSFAWSCIPDDICGVLFHTMASRYVQHESSSCWNTFLALRAVCRRWKDEADKTGVIFVTSLMQSVKAAHHSGRVEDVMGARNVVIDANINTLGLMRHTDHASIYTLMKLRGKLRPSARPPIRTINQVKRAKASSPSCSSPKQTCVSPKKSGLSPRQRRERWSPVITGPYNSWV